MCVSQSNVFLYVLSLKPSKKIVLGLKIAILAALLAYIVHVLKQQPFDWSLIRTSWQSVEEPGWWAAGLLLLIPVNWGLEALKWQILLRRVEPASFWATYRGVLAGVTLGFALPMQLGDTAGRVLSLQTVQRGEAVGAALVSGGMQFYVALIFGAFAWAHHIQLVPNRANAAGQALLVVLLGLVGLGVVFGLVRSRLLGWLARRAALRRWARYWAVAGQYTDQEISLALGVAALRYLVFSVQFFLALRLVGLTLPAPIATSGIGVVYLVKTITPAFNLLSDLGVREAASLWTFAPFEAAAPVLVTATLTLWVANLLVPVLVGLIWVWKLKWSVS